MKVKARSKNGVAKIKLLAKHPMHTGRATDPKTKEVIPAHHITELTCEHKNAVVFNAHLGPAVSKDPYIAFSLKGVNSGDTLKMKWIDNLGKTAEVEATVS